MKNFIDNRIFIRYTADNLQFRPAKEMFDTTWEWQQLIETATAARSVIADSGKYTIVFTHDEIYNAKAECNLLSGGYEVNGSNLTLLPGPSTLAECGPNSSYDQSVGLPTQVDGYEMEKDRLILTFGGATGQMIFAKAGPAEKRSKHSE